MRRLVVAVYVCAVPLSAALACSTFSANDTEAPTFDGGNDARDETGDSDVAEAAGGDGGASPCVDAAVVAAGRCLQLVAEGQDDPRAVIIANGGRVYWSTFGSDGGAATIRAADIDGGDTRTLHETDGGWHPWHLAARDGVVYWGEQDTNDDTIANGALHQQPLSGGTPADVATTVGLPRGIDVTNDFVYWTSWRSAVSEGNVYRAPRTSVTAPELLANGQVDPEGIRADELGYVFIAAGNGLTNPGTVVVSGPDGSVIKSVTAPGKAYTSGVAIGTNRVFWAEWEATNTGVSGSINSMTRDTAGTADVLCTGQVKPLSVVASGSYVYWLNGGANGSDGELKRAARGGGNCELLAGGLPSPMGIDFGAGYVAFTTRGDGRVWSMKVE